MDIVFRDSVTDEIEKREIYDILNRCNDDFCPPLSQRADTSQKNLAPKTENKDGVLNYCNALLGQHTAVGIIDGRIMSFLSYKTDYTCDELKKYGRVYYLTTLCVLPEFRRKGYSEELYKAVTDKIFAEDKSAVVSLRTWSTNGAQMYLMKKLGFSCETVLKDDRGRGIDTMYFVKTAPVKEE